jgi:hypothetical protein
MQFTWNTDTIRWYISANNYTGFYKNIAMAVKPLLNGGENLCDLGCGLALFDFEIAPYVGQIDCFDLNKAALSSVNERLSAAGIGNIKTHLKDCRYLSGAWDMVYMSFFGSRKPDVYLPVCKKLIAVVGTSSQTEMFPAAYQRQRKNTVSETVRYLEKKNCRINLPIIISNSVSPLPRETTPVFLSERIRPEYPTANWKISWPGGLCKQAGMIIRFTYPAQSPSVSLK